MSVSRRFCTLLFKINHPRLFSAQHSKIHNVTAMHSFNKFNYVQSPQNFSTASTTVDQPEEKMGVIKKFMKKVGLASDNSKPNMKLSSFYLYESVADNVNYVQFFQEFDLPDTFNSWFIVTELHVWMLLVRAMAEGSENGQEGRFLRNCIVETMWADVNTRAKKLGSDNPAGMRSQIQVLSQQFQAALITYDEGLASDDKTLAGALWRRFFSRKCDDYQQLEKLVKYVRKQTLILDLTSKKDFLVAPKVTWTDCKLNKNESKP